MEEWVRNWERKRRKEGEEDRVKERGGRVMEGGMDTFLI